MNGPTAPSVVVGESESDKETVPFQISVVTLDPVENFHHAKQMNVLFKPNGRNGTRILHAQKLVLAGSRLDRAIAFTTLSDRSHVRSQII